MRRKAQLVSREISGDSSLFHLMAPSRALHVALYSVLTPLVIVVCHYGVEILIH